MSRCAEKDGHFTRASNSLLICRGKKQNILPKHNATLAYTYTRALAITFTSTPTQAQYPPPLLLPAPTRHTLPSQGLKQNPVTPMGNPIKTAQDCWSTCCGQRDCTTWNWCSGGGCAADGGGCWLGSSAASTCQPNAAWVGGTGRGVPPPPPPPPPALPGAPQNLTLPLTGLSPQPLPYKLGPNVDSESFFLKKTAPFFQLFPNRRRVFTC